MKSFVCIWVRECLVAVLSNRIIIGQSWWERGRSRKKKKGGVRKGERKKRRERKEKQRRE